MLSSTFFPASYLASLSASYLALGVTLPAMSLIVISKGYPLEYLAVIMVMYSVAVMVAEVPSGVFADTWGRKASFLLGIAFSLVGTFCILFNSLFLLGLGFLLTGLGRAFGSGSLDAKYIEDGQRSGNKLEDLVYALELNSGISLSVGALLGGWLLTLGREGSSLTQPLLLVRILFLVGAMVIVTFSIKEEVSKEVKRSSYGEQFRLFASVLRSSPFLVYYSASVLLQGMLLASLESYWQPYLQALLQDDSMLWILGMTTALIFSISILGSLAGKIVVKKNNSIGIYCVLFILVYILQILLSMTEHVILFLGVFSLIYLLLGVLSVVGSYVLNKVAEDRIRTSMISLSSFSLQVGGVLINAFAASLFLIGGIVFFWKVSALVGILGILFLTKPMLQHFPRS